MRKEIINPVLRQDIEKIISKKLSFNKGTVSGFSIEVFQPDTDSYSSYIYYDSEKNRDNDWEIICQLN